MDLKTSPSPERSPQSAPKLRWCLHRGADGRYDCGQAYLTNEPHRLCPAHQKARVRLP